MTEEITDNQVLPQLLAEEEVLGYRVKPWTIKQLLQVMPILDRLAEVLKEKDISLESLEGLIEKNGVLVLKDLLQAGLPQLPDFLAISLRKEKTEMEELDLGQAMNIGVKLLALNVEHLKNAFNLVLGQGGTLTRCPPCELHPDPAAHPDHRRAFLSQPTLLGAPVGAWDNKIHPDLCCGQHNRRQYFPEADLKDSGVISFK